MLKRLLNKGSLDAEEKEAITAAIGILSWSSLARSRVKAQKGRRDKSTRW